MVKNSSIWDCGKVYCAEIQVVDFSPELPNVQKCTTELRRKDILRMKKVLSRIPTEGYEGSGVSNIPDLGLPEKVH
jgi:hypothetical protein